MEGVYYLGMGYVPYEYEIGEDIGDTIIGIKIRESWDYLYHERDTREFIEEDLSNFMKDKFNISNPECDCEYILEKINEMGDKYLQLKKSYDNKLEELTEDVKHELYLLIKNGKISITGVLRYNIKEGGDYENEDDLIETYNTHNDREIIDIKDIIYDNIRWEESEIITKSNKYYIGVLISFEDIYKEKPQQLEYEITAKLIGNKIAYEGKIYQEECASNKGRKSLDWDLFYAELLRYIIENEKGVLPTKQEVTTTHMQNWCKNTGFSTGSRGSIQPKISAIYNALQKVKK